MSTSYRTVTIDAEWEVSTNPRSISLLIDQSNCRKIANALSAITLDLLDEVHFKHNKNVLVITQRGTVDDVCTSRKKREHSVIRFHRLVVAATCYLSVYALENLRHQCVWYAERGHAGTDHLDFEFETVDQATEFDGYLTVRFLDHRFVNE